MSKHLHNYFNEDGSYSRACVICGKPDMWAEPVKRPVKKKRRPETLPEVQERLSSVVIPDGWVKNGIVLDEDGRMVVWASKIRKPGKPAVTRTFSGSEIS
jgi:hypothetical protein